MNRNARNFAAFAAAGLLLIQACGDADVTGPPPPGPDPQPVPGNLVMALSTPNADDGAVSFTVRGGPIGNPTAVGDAREVFLIEVGEQQITGAILGNGISGALVRFSVPDLGQADRYDVTLLQVSDEANALRGSLQGYDLSLSAEGAARR